MCTIDRLHRLNTVNPIELLMKGCWHLHRTSTSSLSLSLFRLKEETEKIHAQNNNRFGWCCYHIHIHARCYHHSESKNEKKSYSQNPFLPFQFRSIHLKNFQARNRHHLIFFSVSIVLLVVSSISTASFSISILFFISYFIPLRSQSHPIRNRSRDGMISLLLARFAWALLFHFKPDWHACNIHTSNTMA